MKKYNKIMAVFTTTVTKLEKAVALNNTKEEHATAQIFELKCQAQALAAESAACSKAIDKINDFMK